MIYTWDGEDKKALLSLGLFHRLVCDAQPNTWPDSPFVTDKREFALTEMEIGDLTYGSQTE